MTRIVIKSYLICSIIMTSIHLGGVINAKYAGDFVSIGVGGRPLGMGGAYVAVAEDVTSIYWNPAGLVLMESYQIHGMHSERFSGAVNWDFIGMGVPLDNKNAVGFGVFRLGVDNIPFTRLRDPSRPIGEYYQDEDGTWLQNVPYVYKYINDSEWMFTFSFSRKRSERVLLGASVKVIHKNMGSYRAWGLGFDFGIILNPYRSLRLGMVLMDATSTLVAWNGGRKEIIAPHIKAGIAYPLRLSDISILPTIDIHMSFENQGSAAQMSLGRAEWNISSGIEALFKDRFAIRFGQDRGDLTAGIGLRIDPIIVDYCFSHHFDLGNTHRISMTIFWS